MFSADGHQASAYGHQAEITGPPSAVVVVPWRPGPVSSTERAGGTGRRLDHGPAPVQRGTQPVGGGTARHPAGGSRHRGGLRSRGGCGCPGNPGHPWTNRRRRPFRGHDPSSSSPQPRRGESRSGTAGSRVGPEPAGRRRAVRCRARGQHGRDVARTHCPDPGDRPDAEARRTFRRAVATPLSRRHRGHLGNSRGNAGRDAHRRRIRAPAHRDARSRPAGGVRHRVHAARILTAPLRAPPPRRETPWISPTSCARGG